MRLRRWVPFVVAVVLLTAAVAPGVAVGAAPANDAFSTAQELSGTSASVAGTTVEATFETGEPPHYTSGDGSVWYSWTAPINSNVHLDTCESSGPTKIQLYRGSSLGSLEEVEPNGNPQCGGINAADSHYFNVKAGTAYRISVSEYVGDATFTLALSAPPAPANDDFADAQVIDSLPAHIAATTADTTVQPGEEGYFGASTDGQSVWYRWTATKDTRMWLDNCGEFGPKVRLYTGAALDSLSPVEELNAHLPGGGASCGELYPDLAGESAGEVNEFMAKAGTTYSIQVLLDDLNYQPAFHLGLRLAHFDGAISETSSRKSIRNGRTVTYTVTVRNQGDLPMSPAVDLVTSKPHKLARPVVGSRYVTLKPSQGTCERVKFFAVHPGAICEPGVIPPGKAVTITAVVRPSQSLSHWAEIDYLHQGEGNNDDDNPGNSETVLTTTVTGGHAHHRHHHHPRHHH